MKTAKTAYVFSISDNADEHNYACMALMLVDSVLAACPDASLYCGVFTNHPPAKSVLNILSKNCHIIADTRLSVSGVDNYFLREYTCWYFSNVLDLTAQYDKVVYTDIDVLHFSQIPQVPPHSIYVEPMPDVVKAEELSYKRSKVFFNWVNIITKTNKCAWDIDFGLREQDAERAFTENIEKYGLNQIRNDFGAIYPVKPLTDHSACFHYDNFEQRGYFYKLRGHRAWMRYKKYLPLFSTRYYNDYWERKAAGLPDEVREIGCDMAL